MKKNFATLSLTPHLVVKGAARAIDWYVDALGAVEEGRFVDKKLGPEYVVHASIKIGDFRVTLSEENKEWHNTGPLSLGGASVILALDVDDVDALAARMIEKGGKVIFPVADQFYGERQGRIADPFGHVWRVGQKIREMTMEEIQQGVDAYHEGEG